MYSMNAPSRCGFLDLPRELRNDIYHLTLENGVYAFEDHDCYFQLKYRFRKSYKELGPVLLPLGIIASKQIMSEALSELYSYAVCTRISQRMRVIRAPSKFGFVSRVRKLDLGPSLWNNFNIMSSLEPTRQPSLLYPPPQLTDVLDNLGPRWSTPGSELSELILTLRIPELNPIDIPKVAFAGGLSVDIGGLAQSGIRSKFVRLIVEWRCDPLMVTGSLEKWLSNLEDIKDMLEDTTKIIVCGNSFATSGFSSRTWTQEKGTSIFAKHPLRYEVMEKEVVDYSWCAECLLDRSSS